MTTTNNTVNVPLSGSTGTVNFVGVNSPTLVTPTLGAATATSIAFSPTTGGIIGTTAADNTSTGNVGEFITSNVAYSPGVSLSNGSPKDVTSIALSAGDWDVWGNVSINSSVHLTDGIAWTNTSSATQPDKSLCSELTSSAIVLDVCFTTNYLRVNVNGNQTVYLSAQCSFATGTVTASGSIFARRIR